MSPLLGTDESSLSSESCAPWPPGDTPLFSRRCMSHSSLGLVASSEVHRPQLGPPRPVPQVHSPDARSHVPAPLHSETASGEVERSVSGPPLMYPKGHFREQSAAQETLSPTSHTSFPQMPMRHPPVKD